MITASAKKRENIAEYLLYMWQIEDIIRAYGLDIDKIKKNIVDRYTDLTPEQRKDMVEWYESLIDMMRREEVVSGGHLQINRNTVGDLADLHRRLLADGRYQDYTKAFYDALPAIVDLRSRSGENPAGEVETCFNTLYATLLMRMKKQEISPATADAIAKITRLTALLAAYYAKDERGELFGKDEDDTDETHSC